jgi:homoprotocatechuate degradation regulator HpaR
MTRTITYRNVPQLLLKTREALLCHFRPIITHFGLTEQQWRILRTLSENESLEPREICEKCHILSPSMAGVLSRLEAMELVKRSRFAGDQRRVQVSLTEKSEKLVAEMAPLIEQQYVLLEESLGKDLLNQVYTVLDRVLAAEKKNVLRIELPPRAAAPLAEDSEE